MRNDSSDVHDFEEWSRSYEQSRMQNLYFDRVHRAALALVSQPDGEHMPGSVLDVGCGTGRLLRKAREGWPAASLTGVDPTQGMIDVARRLMPEATFHTASAESLPLPDASVEVVITTMSFHHWKDRAAGVREIARVLRPGGRFCLADATLPAWLARLTHHMEGNSFATWRALVESAGLSVAAQKRTFLGHVLVMLSAKP
ncbi:MAG TPA: class I SAM-dependent methyltransferase [bacterium]|nr:class I SAM-dependent methyltransferase [bacterium]